MSVHDALQELPIAVSDGVTGNNGEIPYGGVDEEGEQTPGVKTNPFGETIFDR